MTTFDVSTLDALAEQAGAYTLAVWGAADGDAWPQVTAEALTGFVIQGEQIGRTFGMAVEPRDGDPVLPVEVVEGRNPGWRRPPEGFVQRSGEAPEPDVVLRYDQRVDELLERLTLAARTIAAGDVEDAEGRVERLARDETVQAAQRGYQDGLRLHAALDAAVTACALGGVLAEVVDDDQPGGGIGEPRRLVQLLARADRHRQRRHHGVARARDIAHLDRIGRHMHRRRIARQAFAGMATALRRAIGCAAARVLSSIPLSARMPAARNGTIMRITCSIEVLTPKSVSAIARSALIPDILNAAAPSMKCTRQNSSMGGMAGAVS